ncbi:methylenetetrahydrofolate reductase C-terminal domain-containing protein [Chloroflexota bacterium]
MIVTTQKPLDEVLDFISPYEKVLIIGCDGCTQPPRGLREAETLGQLLELGGKLRNKNYSFKSITTAKQCDPYITASAIRSQIEGFDAVLSLACGIGVQTLAQLFNVPAFPAQNTHFMGAEERDERALEIRCGGCGDCFLALTGGICPVARCTKSLITGPCGGSKNGKCELSPDRDCGWVLIYDQLKKQGKLNLLNEFRQPRDYQLSGWQIKT